MRWRVATSWMDAILEYPNPYQRMMLTAKVNEITRALYEWNDGYGRGDTLTSSEED